MGRKTFESIGKHYQTNQYNNNSTKRLFPEGCIIARALVDTRHLVKNETECFIIGGKQIYEESLKYVDKMYITEINTTIKGDTNFSII